MRFFLILIFLLAFSCCAPQETPKPSLKDVVRRKVVEMNNALVNDDFATIVNLTHPKLVKMKGGRAKMIATMQSGTKEMTSQGIAFRSFKLDDPSDPVTAGSELFVVVPLLLEMTVPGGKLLQKTFVIGVSSDDGKTWTFVNGDLDVKKVKLVLTNLPEQLTLPERQKPVFEKD